MYGGSLGRQTTVKIGVRLLKPVDSQYLAGRLKSRGPTSNGKFGATGDKLEEVPALLCGQLAHGLEQIPHALAVHVESMVRLDRIHQC